MKKIIIVLSICLAGCDTMPVRGTMVDSNKDQSQMTATPLGSNTFYSTDKSVEFQATLHNGVSEAAIVEGAVINHRTSPVILELKTAFQQVLPEGKRNTPNNVWFEDCFKKLMSNQCMFSSVEVPPNTIKKIRLSFTHTKNWLLILPIGSKSSQPDKIEISFRVCEKNGDCTASK